jgi:hypothetical protein
MLTLLLAALVTFLGVSRVDTAAAPNYAPRPADGPT